MRYESNRESKIKPESDETSRSSDEESKNETSQSETSQSETNQSETEIVR
jgi:hypothetical protein